jgi:hypothetical protein
VKTLFTIHAGEFLVGEEIQARFKAVNIWLPSKDTGTDLLVTDLRNKRSVSLQVKFSRDYLATHMPTRFRVDLKACGWWTLNRERIAESKADYWVFVLRSFRGESTDFVVIKPSVLLNRLERIHERAKTIQSYLWLTKKGLCWETHGLKRKEQIGIAEGHYSDVVRDFSAYLNCWRPIEAINGK